VVDSKEGGPPTVLGFYGTSLSLEIMYPRGYERDLYVPQNCIALYLKWTFFLLIGPIIGCNRLKL